MKISKLQQEVIEGSLLGDGHISSDKNMNSYFQEEHSIKQMNYLTWKYRFLKDLCNNAPKVINRKSFISIKLRTKRLSIFTYLRTKWYNHKKDIPENFQLTPLKLAIWYMDDGDMRKDKIARISCFSFSTDKIIRMIEEIKKFGIFSHLASEKRIIISSRRNVERFIEIIKPYIPKCMKYKIKAKWIVNEYRGRIICICKTCGRKFKKKYYDAVVRGENKFCSPYCYQISRKKEKV